jgi:hypothetical protein
MKVTEIVVKKTALEVTAEDWRVLSEAEKALTDYCDAVDCDHCIFQKTCEALGDKSPGLVLRMILGDLDD